MPFEEARPKHEGVGGRAVCVELRRHIISFGEKESHINYPVGIFNGRSIGGRENILKEHYAVGSGDGCHGVGAGGYGDRRRLRSIRWMGSGSGLGDGHSGGSGWR